MIRCLATGHEVIARLLADGSSAPPDEQQEEWLQFLGFSTVKINEGRSAIIEKPRRSVENGSNH